MSAHRFRSLQLRLAVRLTLLFVAVSAIIVGILVWRAYDTADTLGERELSLRAGDLASYVRPDTQGTPQVVLPAALREAYNAAPDVDMFAIRDGKGRVIAAAPAAFGALVERWPTPSDDPSYFHLPEIAGKARDYYGLGVTLDSAAGPVSIWVARAGDANALVHALLQEFVVDVAWVIPIFMLLTLAVAVLATRGTLRPVREVSKIAATIGPGTTSSRLPIKDLPSEIVPLVAAVNHAFERLEQGFAVQRQFTANAAHELRTPLAIVTGALGNLEQTPEVDRLVADVGRMNRLVEQLLSVARLDAIALDVSDKIDLNEIAKEVVGTMAPWSLAQGRALEYVGPDRPIVVRGNALAVGDALRNLIENAVAHAPAGSEVRVTASSDGTLSVSDRGPGVAPEDRQHVFDRFWRSKGKPAQGAGLGLAIVAEIMKAHGGSVSVEDRRDGGATFTLSFRSFD
jgi:signal transduction histidine kinase